MYFFSMKRFFLIIFVCAFVISGSFIFHSLSFSQHLIKRCYQPIFVFENNDVVIPFEYPTILLYTPVNFFLAILPSVLVVINYLFSVMFHRLT